MYKPNRHFVKQLKALDPKLGCEYNRDTERFNITFKRATGLPVPIMQVRTEDNKFRQPDTRELVALGLGDLAKTSRRDHLNKASKYCAEYREKQARDARDNIRNMTKDGKIQLKNAFGRLSGAGKGNATFRRITHKPKGQVFK